LEEATVAGQYDHIGKRMRGSARGDQDGISRAPRSQVGGNGRRPGVGASKQGMRERERERERSLLKMK